MHFIRKTLRNWWAFLSSTSPCRTWWNRKWSRKHRGMDWNRSRARRLFGYTADSGICSSSQRISWRTRFCTCCIADRQLVHRAGMQTVIQSRSRLACISLGPHSFPSTKVNDRNSIRRLFREISRDVQLLFLKVIGYCLDTFNFKI